MYIYIYIYIYIYATIIYLSMRYAQPNWQFELGRLLCMNNLILGQLVFRPLDGGSSFWLRRSSRIQPNRMVVSRMPSPSTFFGDVRRISRYLDIISWGLLFWSSPFFAISFRVKTDFLQGIQPPYFQKTSIQRWWESWMDQLQIGWNVNNILWTALWQSNVRMDNPLYMEVLYNWKIIYKWGVFQRYIWTV